MSDETDKLIEEWAEARRRKPEPGNFSQRVMEEIRGAQVVEPTWKWSEVLAKAALVTLAAVLGGARILLAIDGVLGGAN